MIVWLKCPDGACARIADRWNPTIYVSGNVEDLLDLSCQPFISACSFMQKFVLPGDLERSTVLEIEVRNEAHAKALAKRVQLYGNYSKFRLYNVDVPFTQMYLYEKDLFPLAFVQAECTNSKVQWTLEDSRDSFDYKLPEFRKIRLQVRTTKTNRIQGFGDELDSFTLIRNDGETFKVDSGDECDKIHRIIDAFHELDPDIVLTENGDSFIFPYLVRRAQHNGIRDQLILDREGIPLSVYETQGHSYFSYGKIL